MPTRILAAALAATLALAPVGVLAQSAGAQSAETQTTETSSATDTDAVTALLGPAQPPAPEPTPAPAAAAAAGRDQDPAEVSLTRQLNTQVAQRNQLADQIDRANAARYREEKADVQAERERIDIDASINAQSRAEYQTEQQDRYDKAMADWRATVAACDAGETARCHAGSQPALPGDATPAPAP